jgi:hypothetical protein
MGVRLSALRASCTSPQGRFLVLISVRGLVDPRAIVRLEGLRQLRKSNDLIGIRIRNLTTCSIVLQPTTLPHAPMFVYVIFKISILPLQKTKWVSIIITPADTCTPVHVRAAVTYTTGARNVTHWLITNKPALFSDPEDGSQTFLRDVTFSPHYKVLKRRRTYVSRTRQNQICVIRHVKED